MEQIICDDYIKGEKNTLRGEQHAEFNRKIMAVNTMYGWLYAEGILKATAFVYQDYDDIFYFGVDVADLRPYREKMLKSGIQDAELAVHHIFDEEYSPCRYSGAIELSWFMSTYRDVDGCVSRSWECDLIRHMPTAKAYEVWKAQKEHGVKDAVRVAYRLAQFHPALDSKMTPTSFSAEEKEN